MIRHAICAALLAFAPPFSTSVSAQDAAPPPTPAPPTAAAPTTTCPDDQPYCEFSQLVIKPGAPGTGMRSFRRTTPGLVTNGMQSIDRNALRLPKASVGMAPVGAPMAR